MVAAVLNPSGTTFVRSGDGALKRVTRVDHRLASSERGERPSVASNGIPPPSLAVVKRELGTPIPGELITAIGYVDVREKERGPRGWSG